MFKFIICAILIKDQWCSAFFLITPQLFSKMPHSQIGKILLGLVAKVFSILCSLRRNCSLPSVCQTWLQLHGNNQYNFTPWKPFEFSHTFKHKWKMTNTWSFKLRILQAWTKGPVQKEGAKNQTDCQAVSHKGRLVLGIVGKKKSSGFWWLRLIIGFSESPRGRTAAQTLHDIQSLLGQTVTVKASMGLARTIYNVGTSEGFQ